MNFAEWMNSNHHSETAVEWELTTNHSVDVAPHAVSAESSEVSTPSQFARPF